MKIGIFLKRIKRAGTVTIEANGGYFRIWIVVAFLALASGAIYGTIKSDVDPKARSNQPSVAAHPSVAALPVDLYIQPSAKRGPEGEISIEGRTNLPDGMTIGVEFYAGERGKSGRSLGQDYDVVIDRGQFHSLGFTRGNKPYPSGKYRAHFTERFDRMQSPEVNALIGEGGKRLRGKLFKLIDPELVDSDTELDYTEIVDFPPLSQETKAIALVKGAVLTGGGMFPQGRSLANVGKTVEWYMTMPDIYPGKGWTAERSSSSGNDSTYAVSFDFLDGSAREPRQAVWSANLTTGEVRFTNKAAKYFSWMPPE